MLRALRPVGPRESVATCKSPKSSKAAAKLLRSKEKLPVSQAERLVEFLLGWNQAIASA